MLNPRVTINAKHFILGLINISSFLRFNKKLKKLHFLHFYKFETYICINPVIILLFGKIYIQNIKKNYLFN